MPGWDQIGRVLLVVGVGLAVLGGLIILLARLLGEDRLPVLGRLPGDIRIERPGVSCFIPLVSSILVSLLLTLLLNLILRILRR